MRKVKELIAFLEHFESNDEVTDAMASILTVTEPIRDNQAITSDIRCGIFNIEMPMLDEMYNVKR